MCHLTLDDVKSVMLPFRVEGSLEFRRCGLYHLRKTMPEMPDGLVFDVYGWREHAQKTGNDKKKFFCVFT